MTMARSYNIKLPLSEQERKQLRRQGVRIRELTQYAPNELEVILDVDSDRARLLYGLAAFQQIPSVGIKFAEDLTFLELYALEDLRGKDPARLINAYELKKGFWTDPCVEDQFWLAIHVADTGDYSRNWWDFTSTRKAYREQHGYPEDRPKTAWFEV